MQYKSFMEALKGKQHKIDKNKNGKIDSHDFKLLRKEEAEDTNESFDFNRAAMAKQRLMNLKGKKVRGANIANLMRAAGLKEEELEESELDQLDEVLSADAKASDWIHDFVHSTNPKFEGKSKKERIQMALGAYYNTQKKKDGISEEHIDEGLGSIITSAFQKMKAKLTPSTKPSTPPAAPVKVKLPGQTPAKPAAKPAPGTKLKAGGPKPTMPAAKPAASSASKPWRPSAADRKAMQDKLAKERPNNDASVKASIAGRKAEREAGLREEVRTTHEDPLVTVHDKDGLHTHANLSTANAIFNTNVGHKEVHKGPVKTKDGHETQRDLTFAISKHHETEMRKEEIEQFISQLQLDEETIDKVLEAVKKVGQPVDVDKIHAAGQEPHEEKFETFKKKPVKEEYDEEGNITYSKVSFSQFMEAMTATQVRPGVTRYTGGSYGSAKGAKYGNTDYDNEDIDKKEDESQEQPKRGRGRPAGAKSGARGPRIK